MAGCGTAPQEGRAYNREEAIGQICDLVVESMRLTYWASPSAIADQMVCDLSRRQLDRFADDLAQAAHMSHGEARGRIRAAARRRVEG